jgi:streptomycin 6-kinase
MSASHSLNQQVVENNAELVDSLNTVSKQWALTELMPLKVNEDRYIAKAVMQGSQSVILKVHSRRPLFLSEYHTLTHFQGAGCIKLLDSHHKSKALLLEQAIPGISLAEDASTDIMQKITIYAQIIKTLAEKPAAKQNLVGYVPTWLKVIDDAKYSPHIERRYYEKACELRAKLLSTQKHQYVCHGDLHLDNIINRHNEWIVIDPVGVVADMEFEVSACDMLTSRDDLAQAAPGSSQILERATLLSKMLNLDLDRLLSWYFIRKVCLKMRINQ